ncbi:MAG: N-glycosylase/DNA lyase, partial [Nitrososphaerota archaeon]|nr:N-glycosylase/DNA lyase [Nitrososphaerota archaeon]
LIFAVKMFYYAVMVREKERIRLDMKLPVPVDSRLIRITRSLGLVSDVHRPKAMEIQRAWGVISRIAGIPPLNIDSLLWPYKGGDILAYLEGLAKT